jgi:hypothetical protein
MRITQSKQRASLNVRCNSQVALSARYCWFPQALEKKRIFAGTLFFHTALMRNYYWNVGTVFAVLRL